MKSRKLLVLLSSLVLALMVVEPAPAGTLSVKQKVEFNKLVQERGRLHRRLQRLDENASRLMLNGNRALVVHAEQVSVQDQLDLVELRLAILATRHGVEVPPLIGRDPLPDGEAEDASPSSRKIEQAFARGRERAVERLKEDGRRLLASLDFAAFLGD